jgi:hypothetical protein
VPGVAFLVALVAAGMRGAARPVVLAVGAVPLVVLGLPFVLGLFDAAGLLGAAVPAVAAVLLGAPLAVVVAELRVRWPAALVPLVAAVAASNRCRATSRGHRSCPVRPVPTGTRWWSRGRWCSELSPGFRDPSR